MKFKASKQAMQEVLRYVLPIVERKNTSPILSTLLLELQQQTLQVTATDLDVETRTQVEVEGLENGRVTLSARSLNDAIKNLKDSDFTFSSSDTHWIDISCGKASVNLMGLNAFDFPKMSAKADVAFTVVSAPIMKDMIDYTSFAISEDEARYFLNGVFLVPMPEGHMRMVAADGFKLSYLDTAVEAPWPISQKGIVIPRKGVQELRKLCELVGHGDALSLALSGSTLLARTGLYQLCIRLMDVEYPDFVNIIPKTCSRKMTIQASDLIRAIQWVSMVHEDRIKPVRLSMTSNACQLTASSPQRGDSQDTVECQLDGEPLEIGFQATYLLEALHMLERDRLTLEFNDAQSGVVIRSHQHPGVLSVVMSLRI